MCSSDLFSLKINKEQIAYSSIIFLIIFSSIGINPIVSGSSSIYNHPSSDKIKEIVSKDNKSYWISYNNIVQRLSPLWDVEFVYRSTA